MDDVELTEVVARVGNLYVRQGLSPPFHLRDAAKHWLGLDVSEIVDVIDAHFRQHRRLYVSGSGDGYFHMVEAAVRQRWEAQHPVRSRVEPDEPRPVRKRMGPVRPVVHEPSGPPPPFVDAFAFDDPEAAGDDDEDADA